MPHALFLFGDLAIASRKKSRSKQSAEVDYVSGGTQSANAFYYAVVDALNKAKVSPADTKTPLP